MQNKYTQRREAVYAWIKEENLEAVIMEDTEGRRNTSLRYLCGMPSDAILMLTAEKKSILVPWDINLAEQFADADVLIPYSEYDRKVEKAVAALAEKELPSPARIEVSSVTPVPVFEKIRDTFTGEIFCRDGGIDGFLDDLRSIKDKEEIAVYREASRITDTILQSVTEAAKEKEMTEIDIAFLIEMNARQYGAEGTGFATLAAGPARSYAIHAFPNYTSGLWGTAGLSILDFGILVDGYTTDVTCTAAKQPLHKKQEEMIRLVEEAHNLLLSDLKPGMNTDEAARRVEAFFTENGYTMPHALGHGIGLAAHEAPYFRTVKESAITLKQGMIFTIEPGLYDKEAGGVRMENDFLVTETGLEQLTNSRIYTLP